MCLDLFGSKKTKRLEAEIAELKAQLGPGVPAAPTVVGKITWTDLFNNYMRLLPVARGSEVKDAEYDIISLADWQNIFASWAPDQNNPYLADVWDCDNYELATEYWASKWALKHNLTLPCGAVMGELAQGGLHAWNILFGRDSDGVDKLAFLDFTPGWPWRGKVHTQGDLWASELILVWM